MDNKKFAIIKISKAKGKKFSFIIYQNNKKIKTYNFGSLGYSDYTSTHDDLQRAKYIMRHDNSNEDWDNINPGSLSRYILWEYKSIHKAIQEYSKRFDIEIRNQIKLIQNNQIQIKMQIQQQIIEQIIELPIIKAQSRRLCNKKYNCQIESFSVQQEIDNSHIIQLPTINAIFESIEYLDEQLCQICFNNIEDFDDFIQCDHCQKHYCNTCYDQLRTSKCAFCRKNTQLFVSQEIINDSFEEDQEQWELNNQLAFQRITIAIQNRPEYLPRVSNLHYQISSGRDEVYEFMNHLWNQESVTDRFILSALDQFMVYYEDGQDEEY